jgi:hypothetical protein
MTLLLHFILLFVGILMWNRSVLAMEVRPGHRQLAQAQGQGRIIIGQWNCAGVGVAANTSAIVLFDAGGNYRSVMVIQSVFGLKDQIIVGGNYRAVPGPNGTIVVTTVPAAWTPQQRCDTTTGACTPLHFDREVTPYSFIDDNTYRHEFAICHRQR